jgi:hypothetical protein
VSTRLFFERVRRSIGGRGGVIGASGLPPAIEGRPDDYRLTKSTLLEDATLVVKDVGTALPCPDPIAFLDGTQRYEVVGYFDTMPVVAGILSAAARLRSGGEFKTIERAERRVLVGRQEALAAVGASPGLDQIVIEGDERVHPLKELENARRAIDSARTALEHTVGARFRRSQQTWLIVDGVISDTPIWASDPKVIGVSKSHATLPFDGDQLTRYLTLPAGYRTSIFEPTTWRFAPVHSWALRLWPFEGKDLLHGLIRVEVAVGAVTGPRADELSRWLLAERVPLSRPDPRWDRLLYGVAAVERHLRVQ